MTALKVQYLTKSHKDRQIVCNVSVSIDSEQIVDLLDPNGTGKATCFYMIVGPVQADQGVVRIDEQNVIHLPMHGRTRAGTGYLSQETSIFRKLLVSDSIMATLETRNNLDRNSHKGTLEGLLQGFYTYHIRNSLSMSLSDDERRRVEIARVLASAPKSILLDEPFAGVDPISVGDIKQIIHHLKVKGIGILTTDHSVRETLNICEMVYIANDEQLITGGDAGSILASDLIEEVYLGRRLRP